MEARPSVPAAAGLRALRKGEPWWVWMPKGIVRFCRQKPLGAFGGVVIFLMVFAALFATVVSPHSPYSINPSDSLVGPNPTYFMGTDELGRDLFSRIIYGSRASLYVGIMVITFGTLLGSIIGMVSGYEAARFDLAVQRVIDSMQAFPALVLAMAMVAMLGASINNVIIALSIVIIPGESRVVRGATLSVKENQYIEAARAMGAGHLRILFQHIMPNVLAPVVILMSIQLGTVILAEASLSFLGLGTPPPTPTWGGMLSGTGRQFFEIAPWMAIFPGIAISLAVLGFNLLGDAIRDVLDPRLRGSQ